MKSLSLVRYTPGVNGEADSLTEVARHFQTTWATACSYIAPINQPSPTAEGKQATEEDSLYLEADAEGNLLLLQRDATSEFAEDRRRLKAVAEMSLGEMVNKIRPITVATNPDSTAAVVPRAFLATVEGSIYLFGLVHPSRLDLLLRLQTALADAVQSPEQVPFNRYRAFRNGVREGEEPFRFVDGELLDSFLALDARGQEGIVKWIGPVAGEIGGVEGVKGLIEGLRRLR